MKNISKLVLSFLALANLNEALVADRHASTYCRSLNGLRYHLHIH